VRIGVGVAAWVRRRRATGGRGPGIDSRCRQRGRGGRRRGTPWRGVEL